LAGGLGEIYLFTFNQLLLNTYLGSVLTPVSSSRLCQQTFWQLPHSSTGIGKCQISGQSNPALRLPSTKGKRSRILLPKWLSNCHTATCSNVGESPPGCSLTALARQRSLSAGQMAGRLLEEIDLRARLSSTGDVSRKGSAN
jgi:hypothetical protein